MILGAYIGGASFQMGLTSLLLGAQDTAGLGSLCPPFGLNFGRLGFSFSTFLSGIPLRAASRVFTHLSAIPALVSAPCTFPWPQPSS